MCLCMCLCILNQQGNHPFLDLEEEERGDKMPLKKDGQKVAYFLLRRRSVLGASEESLVVNFLLELCEPFIARFECVLYFRISKIQLPK